MSTARNEPQAPARNPARAPRRTSAASATQQAVFHRRKQNGAFENPVVPWHGHAKERLSAPPHANKLTWVLCDGPTIPRSEGVYALPARSFRSTMRTSTAQGGRSKYVLRAFPVCVLMRLR